MMTSVVTAATTISAIESHNHHGIGDVISTNATD
jgi:hypothetical protein